VPESNSSTDHLPDDHVIVGRVGKPHGLRGEFYVFPETDHPDRFAVSSRVFVGGAPTNVIASRSTDDRLIVGVDLARSREDAERLRGSVITIPEQDRRQLDQDEWWPDQLVGLAVLDADGTARGSVVAIVEGVAQDRLVIATPTGRFEIPFVEALVPTVDIEGGYIGLADVGGLLTES
jgi:16S rRNA processing protein RimM